MSSAPYMQLREKWIETFVPGTKCEMKNPALNLKLFRQMVDAIPDAYTRNAVRLAYLTAARMSEAAMITADAVYLDSAPAGGVMHQVVFFSVPVLKKRRPERRIVALPAEPEYEPWAYKLYLAAQKLLSSSEPDKTLLQTGRQMLYYFFEGVGLVSKALPCGDIANPLRHIRIQHLLNYYGFTIEELIAYVDWNAPGVVSFYAKPTWNLYLAKLYKPLP